MMTQSEHMRLHGSELTETQKQQKRDNLSEKVRPKASEWHKGEEGREWHKLHYEKMKECLYEKKKRECLNCGKTYYSAKGTFCSNACKSAYRRKLGIDNETRKCVYCGKEFTVNKYSKSTHCSQSCVNRSRVTH